MISWGVVCTSPKVPIVSLTVWLWSSGSLGSYASLSHCALTDVHNSLLTLCEIFKKRSPTVPPSGLNNLRQGQVCIRGSRVTPNSLLSTYLHCQFSSTHSFEMIIAPSCMAKPSSVYTNVKGSLTIPQSLFPALKSVTSHSLLFVSLQCGCSMLGWMSHRDESCC